MVVFWLDLSLLSSISRKNMWSYYGWVRRSCHLVNTICGRVMVGFVVVVSQSALYGRVMVGFVVVIR